MAFLHNNWVSNMGEKAILLFSLVVLIRYPIFASAFLAFFKLIARISEWTVFRDVLGGNTRNAFSIHAHITSHRPAHVSDGCTVAHWEFVFDNGKNGL